VQLNGQTFLPGQANNFSIFPAIGMAIFATQAKRVTDQMFIESARAVADQVASPQGALARNCGVARQFSLLLLRSSLVLIQMNCVVSAL